MITGSANFGSGLVASPGLTTKSSAPPKHAAPSHATAAQWVVQMATVIELGY
jgi:hypothetical protein